MRFGAMLSILLFHIHSPISGHIFIPGSEVAIRFRLRQHAAWSAKNSKSESVAFETDHVWGMLGLPTLEHAHTYPSHSMTKNQKDDRDYTKHFLIYLICPCQSRLSLYMAVTGGNDWAMYFDTDTWQQRKLQVVQVVNYESCVSDFQNLLDPYRNLFGVCL